VRKSDVDVGRRLGGGGGTDAARGAHGLRSAPA
jgi:hypothetical protein